MTHLPHRLLGLLLALSLFVGPSLAQAETFSDGLNTGLTPPARSFAKSFESGLAVTPAKSVKAPSMAKSRDLSGGLLDKLTRKKPLGERSSAAPSVYDKTLKSTGWVLVPVSENETYTGTCIVIDKQRRLALTNHHVVRQLKKGLIVFPEFRNGELEITAKYYAQSGHGIPFRVLSVDSRRDLALIELDAIPRGIEAIPFASERPLPGDKLHSIGNSEHGSHFEGRLWTHRTQEVKLTGFAVMQEAVVQKGGPTEARLILTAPAFAHGDSGGPIVNERGELVGVVAAINDAGGWSIDLVEVRHFLADPSLRSREGVEGELIGEWKAHYQEGDAQTVFVASFTEEGKCEFYGVKTLAGEYKLAGEALEWSLQGDAIRETGSVAWNDANHFTVSVGKAKYTFERR